MTVNRSSGVFLHLTSLPGPDGIGTLGAPARAFVDYLDTAAQSLWQFCPLGPTAGGSGNSPYQTYSAFAGNPLLISLDALRDAGWLMAEDLADRPAFDEHWVEYDRVSAYKLATLRTAHERFRETATEAERDELASFATEQAHWLDDYVLFRALKDHFGDDDWTTWPTPVKQREPVALDEYRADLEAEIEFRTFCQYCFDRQWRNLHAHASERGVHLVGDMPIYVGMDSADVWANPALFDLDADNEPAAVAGMPTNPDGHGDGQRWGNPLYDWDAMRADGYEWWVRRFESLLDRVDLVRVDHFKGYERYWAIPGDAAVPADGEWRDGPGRELFDTVEDALGDLPVVVEDLGGVTPELRTLRTDLGLPGMKVALYADWCSEDHEYMPHRYPEDSVAYTSTHDTTTVVGWYEDVASDRQRDCLHFYLDDEGPVHWNLVDAVWASDAVFALAPMQDLLGLGGETRFNTPGTAEGNWSWRVTEEALADADVQHRLCEVTDRHGRA